MSASIYERDLSRSGGGPSSNASPPKPSLNFDLDDLTNSSILEFLNQEKECLDLESVSDGDIESIFEEINRLSGDAPSDDQNVEKILREAEMLISKQELGQLDVPLPKSPKPLYQYRLDADIKNDTLAKSPRNKILNLERLSSESTPREMKNGGILDRVEAIHIEDLTARTSDMSLDFNDTERNDKKSNKSSNPSNFKENETFNQSPTDLFDQNSLDMTLQSYSMYDFKTSNSTIPVSQKRRSSFDTDRSAVQSRRNSQLKSPYSFVKNSKSIKTSVDKSTSSSPTPSMMSTSMSFTRERNLEKEIEDLQEKLKDTEERLQSLRLQHDSLSQIHRSVRDNQNQYREEADRYKIEIQHLNECANVLRTELQSARADRVEAQDIQKMLQKEVEESRDVKKKVQEQKEKDVRTIMDLQRQCKEMERILMRKHPDSVSALIVASKNPSNLSLDNSASRALLEQRIAQLEADAKEQDHKAQKILANVQTRFSTVQSKYEQHIGDLETQVLSLQQINADLNEQIERNLKQIASFERPKPAANANSTQTLDHSEIKSMMVDTTSKSTQTDSKAAVVTKPVPGKKGKLAWEAAHPNSHSDAHLLATIRGMRVDLAIKEKAMQRLTKELEECKKTIRKLQKENEVIRAERSTFSNVSKKSYDPALYSEQNADATALKEAMNKIKLLEYDYNALHNKRLQDLNTLQAAHERELASCHETVRILQQRLTERDEALALESRRKVPVDLIVLKSQVSSLERRHNEREERLHMLVEALSKGRLNGSLDGVIS